jgi:hypothetical protein
LFIIISVLPLNSAGTYYVGRDEEGAFFQTDDYGGWYIDEVDHKGFTIQYAFRKIGRYNWPFAALIFFRFSLAVA